MSEQRRPAISDSNTCDVAKLKILSEATWNKNKMRNTLIFAKECQVQFSPFSVVATAHILSRVNKNKTFYCYKDIKVYSMDTDSLMYHNSQCQLRKLVL